MKSLHIHIAFAASLLALAASSCRQDGEQFVVYEKTAGQIAQTLAAEVPNPLSRTTFDLSGLAQDLVLTTPSGARIFWVVADDIFADAATGQIVPLTTANSVKLEFTEALTQREQIGYGISATVGVDPFETGGMAKIKVEIDGKEVGLNAGQYLKINLPLANQQEQQIQDFTIYYGLSASDWKSSPKKVFLADWQLPSGQIFGYEISCRELGWVAAGRPVTVAPTSICAKVSDEFNGQNTLAWMLVPEFHAVVPLDGFRAAGDFCFDHAPTGKGARLITVSKIGGQWLLGDSAINLGPGQFSLDPKPSTEQDVLDFLKSL